VGEVQPSPLDTVAPLILFGGLDDETWRWAHVEGRERCPFLQHYLPSLPDESLQEVFVGSSGANALTGGFQCYELIKRQHEKHAGPLLPSSRILDFGCGWGRVIRYFLKDVEPDNLIGVDKNQQAIALCTSTNRWCRFERCDVLPPTGLDAESFDLVYAWSVFSHLPEEAHLRWLEEFERLLKPGGIAFITTFSRDVLERCSDWIVADPGSLQRWQQRASEIFAPADKWLAAYDRGEFCYGKMSKFSGYFGLTCIPEGYVRRIWSKHFVVSEFNPRQAGLQSVIVCRKRRSGARK
jgi:ubiquinone/menaquinone biosynthesis C-methylase UbiE